MQYLQYSRAQLAVSTQERVGTVDFFAIINAVLQLSNYNFRQFAAPSNKCRLVLPALPAPLATPLTARRVTTLHLSWSSTHVKCNERV